VASAASQSSGTIATIVGIITLMVTASGVFGEMQSMLNAIWKVEPRGMTVSRLIRARAASLDLVVALGLLLIVSLMVSAALTAFRNDLDAVLPFGELPFPPMNFLVSLLPIAVIYNVLPDRHPEWHDVALGGLVTAALFKIGKSLIGWYIGSSAVASSYGAAGALILILLWVITQFNCSCLERNSAKAMPTAMAAGRQNQL
jgi:membrane protein